MKKLLLLISLLLMLAQSKAQDYINNFDSAYQFPLVIDATPGNIWQVGAPHKLFFDSAYSRPNAIMTDTINAYPKNNTSTFTIRAGTSLFPFCGFCGRLLTFEHKFDTDKRQDGGYITTSHDGGITWTDLFHDIRIDSFNLPYSKSDTIAGGIPAFNGNSQGWITTYIYWVCTDLRSDSVMIRFNFKSDTIHSGKEGWMIDNIQLRGEICEGIPGYAFNNNIKLSPNPAGTQLSVSISFLQNKSATFSITNILGETLRANLIFFAAGRSEVYVGDLPAGIYFLHVNDGRQAWAGRFVKE